MHYKHALRIRETQLGPGHADVATCKHNLAVMLQTMHRCVCVCAGGGLPACGAWLLRSTPHTRWDDCVACRSQLSRPTGGTARAGGRAPWVARRGGATGGTGFGVGWIRVVCARLLMQGQVRDGCVLPDWCAGGELGLLFPALTDVRQLAR